MKSYINPFFSQLSNKKGIFHLRYAFYFFSLTQSTFSDSPTTFLHSLSHLFFFPSFSSRNPYRRAIRQFKTHTLYSYYSKPKSLPSHKNYPYHNLSYDVLSTQSRKSKSFKTLISSLKNNYKSITNK